MITSLQFLVEQLKQFSQFQTIPALGAMYDTLKPTTKKVLSRFISNTVGEGERGAFTCLQ